MTKDVKEIEGAICRALKLLHEPGDIIELRSFEVERMRGTVSGYFDSPEAFAAEAARLDGRGTLYQTLNPPHPVLLSRAKNRIKEFVKTTTADKDIARRCLFFVDSDVARPSGTPSCNADHDEAIAMTREIVADMAARGWPEPVIADSGNGGHALWRIDLPNNDESRDLITRCLNALASKYDHGPLDADSQRLKFHVDTGTFNAGRITKVYGTMSCKGDDIPDYPRRRSCILDAPDELEIVPRELLEELAAGASETVTTDAKDKNSKKGKGDNAATKTLGVGSDTSAWLRKWIEDNDVTVQKTGTMNGKTKYTVDCPFNTDHAGDAFIGQKSTGEIVAKCSHNSCAGKDWKDFRLHFEPEAYTRSETHAAGGSESPTVKEAPWPRIAREAFYGLAGDIVNAIAPHTEADKVALLGTLLIAFGSCVGRAPHCIADGARHGANLNVILVGASSKARKGTSWNHNRNLLEKADPTWTNSCVKSGLSSGEGLIYHIRDAVTKEKKNKDGGGMVEVTEDEGVIDKRLLVIEGEYASPLRQGQREGNTLSTTLRNAWDGVPLGNLTKNNPVKATNTHVSILGHITVGEFKKELTECDRTNGFANRNLHLCVKRAQLLPRGGQIETVDFDPLIRRLQCAITHARTTARMDFDKDGGDLWDAQYERLSADGVGLVGDVTARAESQVLRLSLVYALLDEADAIGVNHLRAAYALWDYAEASARHIFGDAIGDGTADAILSALRESEDGMTRTEISDQFDRHKTAKEIDRALALLVKYGRARCEAEATGGRPVERWFTL